MTTITAHCSTMRELLVFLWHRKLWWTVPMVLLLLFLGALLVVGAGSSVAPFIYTLF